MFDIIIAFAAFVGGAYVQKMGLLGKIKAKVLALVKKG